MSEQESIRGQSAGRLSTMRIDLYRLEEAVNLLADTDIAMDGFSLSRLDRAQRLLDEASEIVHGLLVQNDADDSQTAG